jgi:DNA repair protein RecO (recombination protein O)
MNFFKLEGIVINRREYGEGDYYLTIFTSRLGKITFIVKGIKKSKRRDQNSVDLLSKSEFSVYKNKEKFTLSDSVTMDTFENLRRDFFKSSVGFYLAGILNVILIEGEIKEELYNLFNNSLNFLNKTEDTAKMYLLIAYFLNKISIEEGIKYDFEKEISTVKFSKQSEEYEILKGISEGRTKIILDRTYAIESIKKVITIYEQYLNFHLDLSLDLKKYLLED